MRDVKTTRGEAFMTESMQTRIDRMFKIDGFFAYLLLICLWASYLFVFFAISHYVSDGSTRIAMIVGTVVVLIYNTAAVVAMIKHYAEDKRFIYEIDIRHLDEARAAKAAARAGGTGG
jgi:hypothetical protein